MQKNTKFKYFLKMTLFFLLSNTLQAEFQKIGEMVKDTQTGLYWQDNNDTNNTLLTWQGAIDYCETLNLEGKDDWRLPNINELRTIINRTQPEQAIVNRFEYLEKNDHAIYWSSTSRNVHISIGSYNIDRSYRVFVEFDIGAIDADLETKSHYVRCLRD